MHYLVTAVSVQPHRLKNFKGLKNQHLMLISEMKNAPEAKAAGALFSFLGKEETI